MPTEIFGTTPQARARGWSALRRGQRVNRRDEDGNAGGRSTLQVAATDAQFGVGGVHQDEGAAEDVGQAQARRKHWAAGGLAVVEFQDGEVARVPACANEGSVWREATRRPRSGLGRAKAATHWPGRRDAPQRSWRTGRGSGLRARAAHHQTCLRARCARRASRGRTCLRHGGGGWVRSGADGRALARAPQPAPAGQVRPRWIYAPFLCTKKP